MRTPTGAEPRIVEVAWPVAAKPPASRRDWIPLVWGLLLGASAGLLGVRLLYVLGGPSLAAGPLAALGFTLAGGAAGVGLATRFNRLSRVGPLLTTAGLLWLLILFQPLGPAPVAGAAGLTLTWLLSRLVSNRARPARVPPSVLVIAAGTALTVWLLDWPRLARTVVPGDSGEFQALVPSLGVPHPTGYPLFLLAGKLFTLLPLGEPAFALSIFSALLGAVTAALLVLLAYELAREEVAALLAAALFAFAPLVVAQSVMPEVYTLHLALLAASLWLFARWQQTRSPVVGLLLAGTLGLGLAHHRTFLLLLPALGVAWFLTPGLSPRPPAETTGPARRFGRWTGARIGRGTGPAWWWFIAAALLGLPSLSYLYFVWRWPALTGQPITWPEFQAIAFADRFQSLLDPAQLFSAERYRLLLVLLAEQVTGVGLALGLTGLLWLTFRLPYRALPVAGLGALTFVFAALYQVADTGVFLLPAALALAAGAAVVARLLRVWVGDWAHALTIVGLAALVLHQLAGWRPDAPSDQIQTEAAAAVAVLPAGPVLVISDVEHFSPLLYAARVGARRPEIEIVMPDTHDQAYELIEAARQSGRPVYLARHLPRLAERYPVEAAGPLIAIDPPPRPAAAGEGARTVAPGAAVQAVSLPESVRRGERLRVGYTWRLERPLAEAWRPVLVLTGPAGRVVASGPVRDPVAGLFPFPLWRPQQPVRDFQQLPVSEFVPTGVYSVWLLLLRPGEQPPERIADYLPAGEPLGRVSVTPAVESTLLGLPRIATAGDDLSLLAYQLPAAVDAGRPAEVNLTWQAVEATPARQIVVSLEGGARLQATADLPPLLAGEKLSTRIALPAAGAGTWPLLVSVLDGGEPLPLRRDWYLPAEPAVQLDLLRVAPLGQAVPTFDDRIRLSEAQFPASATAGSTLTLRLRWRATARPRSDYTIFVHLVDADGRVAAQVDSRPRQGTLPTDQWPLEAPIEDRYEIPLRGPLQPGRYQLEIGLYDARTMIRLPVTDSTGRPVGDHLDLGQVDVLPAP